MLRTAGCYTKVTVYMQYWQVVQTRGHGWRGHADDILLVTTLKIKQIHQVVVCRKNSVLLNI